MGIYVTEAEVKTFLRTVKDLIEVGTGSDDDLDSTDLNIFIDEAESDITIEVKKAYTVPLALTNTDTVNIMRNIARRLSAFYVYGRLMPSTSENEDIPKVIRKWENKSTDQLMQIVKYIMPLDGETRKKIAKPGIKTREAVFDGIGHAQGNRQFNNDVDENERDGELV